MTTETLQQAINLIKSGKIDAGRVILLRFLKQDSANEQAWLWLSKTYNDNRVQYCMEKVYEINPQNEAAMAFMQKQAMLNNQLEEEIYLEKIRLSNLSKKYLQENGNLVFKPARTRILWRFILPGIVIFSTLVGGVLLLTQTLNPDSLFIFMSILIMVGGAHYMIQTGSGYDVELGDTTLSGPMKHQAPLHRRTIQIQDIDLESMKTFSSSLRIFILCSYHGKSIYLHGFDEETLKDLLDIIYFRQNN